jgi:hypothetical protein
MYILQLLDFISFFSIDLIMEVFQRGVMTLKWVKISKKEKVKCWYKLKREPSQLEGTLKNRYSERTIK